MLLVIEGGQTQTEVSAEREASRKGQGRKEGRLRVLSDFAGRKCSWSFGLVLVSPLIPLWLVRKRRRRYMASRPGIASVNGNEFIGRWWSVVEAVDVLLQNERRSSTSSPIKAGWHFRSRVFN